MGTLIERSNGIFYGIFSVRGKRVWRSTHSRSEDEARLSYEILCQEYASWHRLTILRFCGEHERVVEGTLATSTLRLYRHTLRKFAEIIGDRPLNSVTPYHVDLFKAKRLQEVSPTKVNQDFRTLKAAFNRAVGYGMIDKNPFISCKNVTVPDRAPAVLTKSEFETLMRVVGCEQMRSIILVGVCTAMRLGEIVHLRWEDVDFESGSIHLRNQDNFILKTRRGRIVPLNRVAAAELRSQPRTSAYVFPNRVGIPYAKGSISRKFKRSVRKAGLPESIHFHTLRHSAATWLVQCRVPITYVKEILGHRNISTSMIYAHATAEHLQESVYVIDRLLGDGMSANEDLSRPAVTELGNTNVDDQFIAK